jgi:hypothetical protein
VFWREYEPARHFHENLRDIKTSIKHHHHTSYGIRSLRNKDDEQAAALKEIKQWTA